MEYEGQHISSNIPNLTVNFRTSENNEKILNVLKDFHLSSNKKLGAQNGIEHKIFNENGAAYILLKSNFCERPLKFLIDTGASITLLADDLVPEHIHVTNYIVRLFGVVRDVSVQTQGMIHGIFSIDDHQLETALHLVERRYAGSADGYLGYDFLSSYKTIIDMNEMSIKFNLKSNEKKKEDNVVEVKNNQNFLNILANTYDFEENQRSDRRETERIRSKNKRKKRNEWIKTSKMKNCSENKKEDIFRSKNEMTNEYEMFEEAVRCFTNEINLQNEMKVGATMVEIENKAQISSVELNYNTNERANKIYSELKLKNCSSDEKNQIKQICTKFPYQFYIEGDVLGCTEVIKHCIKLKPNWYYQC